MRRPVYLILGALWAVALAASLGIRIRGLQASLPGLLATNEVRTDVESGDVPYHRFLEAVAAAASANRADAAHLLLMVHDVRGDYTFQFYRAAYELYPTRVLFVPVGTAPPGRRRFSMAVDPALHAQVRDKPVDLAAIYEQADPGRSGVYRVTAPRRAPSGRLEFSSLEIPATRGGAGQAGPLTPASPRLVLWLLGIASLFVFGWAFNRATGLARPFHGDIPATLGLAFISGTGLTIWAMIAMSLAGVSWTLPAVLAPGMLAVAAAAWRAVTDWRRDAPENPPDAAIPGPGSLALGVADIAGCALFGLAVGIAALQAALPVSAWANWDAWAIWFFKAKACRLAAGVPFDFLREQIYRFSHHDYPLGFPALLNYQALWTGGLDARMLRCISPVYLAVIGCLLSRLLRELGVEKGRWLFAGAFCLVPMVLDQASSGYADLPAASHMVASLVLLVSALRGGAAPWAIGFAGGTAALVKDEGLIWGLGCLAVLGLRAIIRRTGGRSVALAAVLLLALAGPWKLTVSRLGLRPNDYVIDVPKMIENMPDRTPLVARAFLLETLGPGVTMPGLAGTGTSGSLGDWFNHVRYKWLLFWYVVAVALVLRLRALARPLNLAVAAVIAVQLAAYTAVYYASIVNLPWHLVTSADRLLLHLAPAAWALAGALLASPAPRPRGGESVLPPGKPSRRPDGTR